MKRILIFIVSLLSFFIVACSNESEIKETVNKDKDNIVETSGEKKRGSIEETARTFVQAMIDSDEEVLKQIYRNPKDPLEYMLPEKGPEFAGMNIDDFIFLLENDGEVQLERKDGKGNIYWLKIEMIGDKYYITNL